MTRNQQGFLAAIALILFGIVMGVIHFLISGVSEQFGAGVVVGLLIGFGLLFLASRQARETP
ncbi:hypothetical protein SAMN05892877_1075 [Rhizobium subbaraonis]|uniref:Uncharacterized protein n=1 Tax=Rhizobium subbaraonis TaxID=908946 RepID=A0A285UDT9_9HYPH|nr:hypothetical protein [Rhizobium subbaraonis]SOC40104.1 hypothetical protein SAMN05892877_1075 [Rhizobium subbaraonis]